MSDQIVELVFNDPDAGRNIERETSFYQNEVAGDRQHPAAVRHSAPWFRGAILQTSINSGLRLPAQTFAEFCNFLEVNPAVCPGWLLFHEAYGDFCDNVQDLGQRGDSPDFSHIITAPYVDAVILDRRMAGYARAASRRLARETGLGQFDEAKVFTTLEDWINH